MGLEASGLGPEVSAIRGRAGGLREICVAGALVLLTAAASADHAAADTIVLPPLWDVVRANLETCSRAGYVTVASIDHYLFRERIAFYDVTAVVTERFLGDVSAGDTLRLIAPCRAFGGRTGPTSVVVDFELGAEYFVMVGYCSTVERLMIPTASAVAVLENEQARFPWYSTALPEASLTDSLRAWTEAAKPEALVAEADVVLRGFLTAMEITVPGPMTSRGSFTLAPEVIHKQPQAAAIRVHEPLTVKLPTVITSAAGGGEFTRPLVKPGRDVIVFAKWAADGTITLLRKNTAVWEVAADSARVTAVLGNCGGEPTAVRTLPLVQFEAALSAE